MKNEEATGIGAGVSGSAKNYADNVKFGGERGHGFAAENAILKGRIQRKLSEDIRGVRYRIEGPAEDGRPIHVICRFQENAFLIIVTAYALTEEL